MPFDFNIFSSLLLPCVLQGAIFAFLLFGRSFSQGRLADLLLAILLILFSIRVANWMLGFAGWYDSHDSYTVFMFYFPWSHFFLYGPLLYFYFRSLTNHQFRFRPKHIWHFIPSLMMLGICVAVFVHDIVISHWIRGEELLYHHQTYGEWRNADWGIIGYVVEVLKLLSVIIYFSVTLLWFKKYKAYLQANFSETSDISFPWLQKFLVVFLISQVIWFAYLIVDLLSPQELSYIEYWYAYFAWGLVIYYVSIAAYGIHPQLVIPLAFEPFAADKESISTEQLSSNGSSGLRTLAQQLISYLEQEKPYLQPDLTLNQLAQQLKVPSATLSKCINELFDQNFNELINRFRVRCMKAKLLDESFQHLSILGIAFDCGFRSKATFNRAFRKHTGTSPSDFRKHGLHTEDSNDSIGLKS